MNLANRIHARRAGQAIVALAAVLTLFTISAQAQAPNVTGTWKLNVETGAGSGTPTLVLKQDGTNITGTYSGQLGEAKLTGTLKGNAIKLAVPVSGQGQDITIEYSGTVEGATMKGKVKLGDLGEGTFTGSKN